MSDAAQRLARSVPGILGPSCRSVILHGSLAAGGSRAGASDIDLLAVTDNPMPDAQPLVDLARHATLGDAAGLDLHVVTTSVARSPSRQPPLELHIGRHPGEPELEIERHLLAAPTTALGPAVEAWAGAGVNETARASPTAPARRRAMMLSPVGRCERPLSASRNVHRGDKSPRKGRRDPLNARGHKSLAMLRPVSAKPSCS